MLFTVDMPRFIQLERLEGESLAVLSPLFGGHDYVSEVSLKTCMLWRIDKEPFPPSYMIVRYLRRSLLVCCYSGGGDFFAVLHQISKVAKSSGFECIRYYSKGSGLMRLCRSKGFDVKRQGHYMGGYSLYACEVK